VRLFVTEAGQALLERAPAAPQGELNRALQRMEPAQLLGLEQALESVIERMASTEPKAGLQPYEAAR